MGKRLVLLFSLLALIFCVVSIQTKGNSAAHSKEAVKAGKNTVSDSLLTWMTNLKNESRELRDQGSTQLAVDKLSEVIESLWRKPITSEEYEKLAWIYANRAYLYHEQQGDFLAAKEDYLSALKQFESCEASDYLVARYVYQPLGNIYTRLGENEIAISMLENFKRACQVNDETEALMNAYNDIARVYLNKNQHERAIESFLEGIELDETDLLNQGLLHSSMAEVEEELENFDRSLIAADKSIVFLNRVLRKFDSTDYRYHLAQKYLVSSLTSKAKVLGHQKNIEKSHEFYNQALELAREIFPEKHRAVGRAWVGLGNSYNSLGMKFQSMECYQMSLKSLSDDEGMTTLASNPEKSNLYADVVLGEALEQKAKTAFQIFNETKKQSWLLTSVKAYLTYFEWVEVQRSERFEFNSKLDAASEIHEIGELALDAFFELSEVSKDPRWTDTAFVIMDQTKAIVLAEERGFKDLAETNPKMRSMLKSQNALKFQRSRFESDLNELGEITNDNTDESLRLKKRLSEIDKESQLLDHDIRALFPSYRTGANSKLEGEVLDQLRVKLKKKKADILSYFVGDESAYVIMGSPGNFVFKRFSRSNLEESALSFLKELNEPSTTAEKYSTAGKSLFDVLIGSQTKKLSTNWVVLPDGVLNSLPFEALVSDAKGTSFKKLNYLVRDYVIHYAPSAFFFAHEGMGEKAEKSFLGMAPVFKGSKSYDFLPKSKGELESGTSLFSGEELTDGKATKKAFFKRAEEYDILHISTHAGTNSGTNNDAWMVFSDKESKDHKLEAHELLKLDLPASLVVLNACETASGTVFRGEGPMSLARGFLNAGSESAVTNLWSVNHESNAVIMKTFYEQLIETQSPSRSLNEAKLAYLASEEIDDVSAHPYYWSSAILVGTDASVSVSNSSSVTKWLLMGLGAVVIFVLGIFLYQKKSRRKSVA